MENKEKRVLHIALDDDVKRVSITGKNGDEKVVMRQELSEDDLEQATGGGRFNNPRFDCQDQLGCPEDSTIFG